MAEKLIEFYYIVTSYLESTINYPKWTKGVYPARESVTNAVADGTQYICTLNGDIVGAFVMNTDPQGDYSCGDWSTELADGEFTIIHALAVLPEMKCRGIGRQMVDYCIQKSRADGYKAVRLDVVPTNTPAERLYKNAGFVYAGEKDLKRGIENIPKFKLYEMVFDN